MSWAKMSKFASFQLIKCGDLFTFFIFKSVNLMFLGSELEKKKKKKALRRHGHGLSQDVFVFLVLTEQLIDDENNHLLKVPALRCKGLETVCCTFWPEKHQFNTSSNC